MKSKETLADFLQTIHKKEMQDYSEQNARLEQERLDEVNFLK